ncbi:MAG: discoidin domain-containing protein [Phycisphaerales bacterium]|nr:MAG: discoidin domain-containing protein [Phycisphaerales bacterium]
MCEKSVYLLGICLILGVASHASADLVGHWAFDEGQGTTAYDSSGNGHHGTLQGDPQWAVGKINGALEFDGDGDYVEVPDHESLQLWERFTLAAWIYQMESRSSRIIDKIGAGTANGPHLDTHPGTTLRSCSGTCISSTADYTLGEWHHVAVTFDDGDMTLYIDGIIAGEGSVPSPLAGNTLPLRIGAASDGGSLFHGLIDDAAVFSHALTNTEIQAAMAGIGSAELAANPNPKDAAFDMPRDVVLNWEAGEFAATHDVYFGTVFDDVNDASRAEPIDVLVSQGQAGTTYAPPAVLEYGQTYYWRVDEVNAAPDNTIFKGETWSFTVEPLAYPVEGVMATSNGISEPGTGPENTVNGSGLNENDEHSVASGDMWLAVPGDHPLQVQYEFGNVLKLHEMLIWNYNVQFELMLGFGVKDVTVEYSEDGENWAALGDVTLNQATAKADYAANTTVDFGGVAAQYVRLTINSGYGPMGQFGLAEVRFLSIPVQAREPDPADGAVQVAVDADLSWRAGREAVSREIYLSGDPNALALIDTSDATTIDPGPLDLAATYYWKVDEVNEAEAVSTWEGAIWSFSTEEHMVVEDFEDYDDEDNRIYESWLDGWVNETGSTVGHLQSPFAEQTIVHGGNQSMPLFYDNTQGITVSEAERNLEVPMDWTVHGIKTLSVAFAGAADNVPGQLYIKVNGTRVDYDGAVADLRVSGWLAWVIDVSALGNIGNVSSVAIGVEGAGASGVLYIDDIRLYPLEAEMVEPVEPDPAGLTAHYELDSDFQDSSGNGNHATPVGDASIVSDPTRGGVASLDGLGDGITVPAFGDGTAAAVTISLWMNTDIAWTGGYFSLFHSDSWAAGDIHMHVSSGGYFTAGVNGLDGGNLQSATMPVVDEWYNVTVAVSAAEASLYVNGIQEESRVPTTVPEAFVFGEGHLGVWLNGANLERGLTGQIDDVRFYNRVLSYGEVMGLAGRTTFLYKPF